MVFYWMETIRRFSVLDEEECARARHVLYSMRKCWRQRSSEVPFFTLGAASYIDSRPRVDSYYEHVMRENPILRENFAWLYERVIDALANHLDGPISLEHDQALPGFHLYLSHTAFEKPIAEIHFDRQQHRLRWSEPDQVEWSNPFSFTLPIALPDTGGGLYTWDVEWNEVASIHGEERKRILKQAKRGCHQYRLGELVVHSGNLLHQVMPGVRLSDSDERFTLQGHALYYSGAWRLYW